MSILAGLVPMKVSDECADGHLIGCGEQISGLPSELEIEILYPTPGEIDTISGTEIPVPLAGGAILKMPAPEGVLTELEISKVDALFGSMTNLPSALEEIGPDGGGRAVDMADILTAKMALNKDFISIAKGGSSGNFKNLNNFSLFLSSTTIDEPSEILSDAPDARVKRNLRFSFIPVEVLKLISKSFAEVFDSAYGTTGAKFSDIASFGDPISVDEIKTVSAVKALPLESASESDNTFDQLMNNLPSLDILAILVNMFNLDRPPLDIQQVIEKAAGELVALLPDLPIETEADAFGLTKAVHDKHYAAFEAAVNDSQMRELLIEFFPVQNISNRTINGKARLETAGFYTIYDGNIYLKLPNLSSMDSAGFYDVDIFFEEEDDGSFTASRHFFFEYILKGEVLRIGFQTQPPPMIELVDDDMEHPGDSGDVKIAVSGYIDNIKKIYLSPIGSAGSEIKKTAKGFTTYDNFLEFFTAPIVTKSILKDTSFYKDDDLKIISGAISSALSSPAVTADNGLVNLSTIFKKAEIVDDGSSVKLVIESPDDGGLVGAVAGPSTLEVSVEDLGFPCTVVPSGDTPGSIANLLGEKNRPEVILTNMKGDVNGGGYFNNGRFVKDKFIGSTSLLVSNRPKFVADYQIPDTMWVGCQVDGEGTDSETQERVMNATISNASITKLFSTKEMKFAVYAIDDLGQMSRASNNVLSMRAATPSLDSATPNGYRKGSGQVKPSDVLAMTVAGDNLDRATLITFDGPGSTVTIDPSLGTGLLESALTGETSLYSVTLGKDKIQIYGNSAVDSDGDGSPDMTTYDTMGFIAGTEYSVTVTTPEGVSNPTSLYVSNEEDREADLPILLAQGVAHIATGSLKAKRFSGNITGVPIIQDGMNNAFIEIKSKKGKIFSGAYDIKAYLAFDSDATTKAIVNQFSFESETKEYKLADDLSVIIPTELMYDFNSGYMSGDFFRSLTSDKVGVVSFPGSANAKNNFSGLESLEKAYLLVTNKPVEEMGVADGEQLPINSFAYVQIGDSENKGFISEPHITGVFAKLPGPHTQDGPTFVTTMDANKRATGSEAAKEINNIFGDGADAKFVATRTATTSKIKKLAVVHKGLKDTWRMKKDYEYYLGTISKGTKIKKKFFKLIDYYPGTSDELITVLKDVETTQKGLVPIIVQRKHRKFNTIYNSSVLYQRATTKEIAIQSSDISDEMEVSIDSYDAAAEGNGLEGPEPTEVDGVKLITENFLNTPGLIESKVGEVSPSMLRLFDDVSIKTSTDLTLLVGAGDAEPTGKSLSQDSTTEEIKSFGKTSVSIPATNLKHGSYLINKDRDKIKALLQLQINNHAAVRFNEPRITKIKINGNTHDLETIDGRRGLAGEALATEQEIVITVAGAQTAGIKNGSVITLGGSRLKVEGTPVQEGEDAVITASVTSRHTAVVAADECIQICVSNDNEDRERAKINLGNDPVINIPHLMKLKIFGPGKNKPPNLDFLPIPPLNLGPLKLKIPSVPPELINSICNFSFHLTAELNLGLRNLYILMIPIQVIFCIIDVLCALMNPFKVVPALIRLFECLYDLILLLPQLSVPVMYLNLILHLLEILECILRKILWLIMAINALITAFVDAYPINPDTGSFDIRYVDWDAIKNLEETIATYLFELEADLDFLGPIMQILGMFLQLLQLLFRFPCSIHPGGGDYICGLDGTALAALVGGKVLKTNDDGDKYPDPTFLVPVAQSYTKQDEDDAFGAGTSTIIDISTYRGSVVANQHEDGTYLSTMFDNTEWKEDEKTGEEMISVTDVNDNLRVPESTGAYSGDPKMTFTASFTKTKKGYKNPARCKFVFNKKAEPSFFVPGKILERSEPTDYPLILASESSGQYKIASSQGQLISPIDGYEFLKSGKSSVKPLTVTFEWVEQSLDETTGEVIETEVSVDKTFDNIPSLAIIDQEYNLYFIDEDGIEWDGNEIISIKAKVINKESAPKHKMSKETQDFFIAVGGEILDDKEVQNKVDSAYWGYYTGGTKSGEAIDPRHFQFSGEESITDSTTTGGPGFGDCVIWCKEPYWTEAKVYNFPQISFFDMRQLEQDLNDACLPASILDSIIPEEEETDEVAEIIEESLDCIEAFVNYNKEKKAEILSKIEDGIPFTEDDKWSVDEFTEKSQELKECLEDSADKMCYYVVHPLTSQFKVLEDTDPTPLGPNPDMTLGSRFAEDKVNLFPMPSTIEIEELEDAVPDEDATEEEVSEEDYDDARSGPSFTGAREYAAGIGDNAILPAGGIATIQVIARDCYDNIITADLTKKIEIEIVKDTTDGAIIEMHETEDGEEVFVEKIGYSYQTTITANKQGEVKLRVSVCGKTLMAYISTAIKDDVKEEIAGSLDCITDPATAEEADSGFGSLTKVDRIITILFTRKLSAVISEKDDDALVATSVPQEFGTKLEN